MNVIMKKKIGNYVMALLAVVLCVNLSGCNKDDEGGYVWDIAPLVIFIKKNRWKLGQWRGYSWWYGSWLMIVMARYSCSVKMRRIISCENVIFDSDIFSLARSYTSGEKP